MNHKFDFGFSPKSKLSNYGAQKSNEKFRTQRSKSKNNTKAHQFNKQPYFCHYKNAMYMGDAKCFQKNGKGILIHDNGTTAITNYYNDMLQGENLLFLPNGATVATSYSKDKLCQAIYKNKQKIFYAKYQNDLIDGYCILINFLTKEITYSLFKKGHMVQKSRQEQSNMYIRIFEQKKLQFMLPLKLINYLNLEFPSIKDLEIIRKTNKISIGFCKNGFINGLGFVLLKINQNTSSFYQSNTQLIERGFYKNSQLHGTGQKIFKNGNTYIGQFKNDLFQGYGILKNFIKKNWISGIFQNGNLIQLKKSSEGSADSIDKVIQQIHQKKSSFLKKQINLVLPMFFQKDIQKIQNFRLKDDPKHVQMKKNDILKKILQNFVIDIESEGSIMKFQNRIKQPKLMQSPSGKYLRKEQQQIKSIFKNSKQRIPLSQKKNYSKHLYKQSTEKENFDESQIPQINQFKFKVLPVPFDQEIFQSTIKMQSSRKKDLLCQSLQNNKIEMNMKQEKVDKRNSMDPHTLVGLKSLSLLQRRRQMNNTRQKSRTPTPKNLKINQNILDMNYKKSLKKSFF